MSTTARSPALGDEPTPQPVADTIAAASNGNRAASGTTGGDEPTHRRAWFVVFTPDGDGEPAAMVSIETEAGRNVWNGSWTFDPDRVAAVEALLAPL